MKNNISVPLALLVQVYIIIVSSAQENNVNL